MAACQMAAKSGNWASPVTIGTTSLFIFSYVIAIRDAIYCIWKEVKETDQGQYVSFLRRPVPRVNLQADLIADVLYALITKD